MPKLVWRVKLVAELRPGEVTETEVARIERDEQAGTADLGLRLAETKQLMAALQDQIVPAQVAVVGERHSSCVSCGRRLASKGHYPVTFRSLSAMCRFGSDGCLPALVRARVGRRVSPP
ncbi:MAG: hypothetical protein QOD93_4299 [Acetobacteraceae bacterium]|nr:hypothetical protein [Acetobacteraceae bacterium]